MNPPPKTLSLELNHNDVRMDIANNIATMDRIRAEAIAERSVSDAVKDEYLHLTYRVSSGLAALPDPWFGDRIKEIDEMLRREPALAGYDPLQDTRWAAQEPKFSDRLERVLISALSDRFGGTDEKHHLLQAIRYLGTKDQMPAERDVTLTSILPYRAPAAIESRKRRWYERVIDFAVAENHVVEIERDLTLRFKSVVSAGSIGDLVDFATRQGFLDVRMPIAASEYRQYKGQILNYTKDVRDAPNNTVELRFTTTTHTAVSETGPVSEFLTAICDAEILPEILASLRQGPENHHAFGQAFMKAIDENVPRPAAELRTEINRPFGSVTYRHTTQMGKYRKDLAALCTQDRRYLITSTSCRKDDPLPSIAQQLAAPDAEIVALRRLGETDAGLRHARIITYENSEPTRDNEVNA